MASKMSGFRVAWAKEAPSVLMAATVSWNVGAGVLHLSKE